MTDAWDARSFRVSHMETSYSPQSPIGLVTFGLLHGEEQDISGDSRGTGAVYVHGCALRCSHCYQHEFYDSPARAFVSESTLVELLLEFEREGAKSILWVASHFQEALVSVMKLAREAGLQIPFVYKYSGLMSLSQIEALSHWVEIFVPDVKAVSPSFLKHQQLPAHYGHFMLEGVRWLIDRGHRVILRYLWIPTFAEHATELTAILKACVHPTSPAHRASLSLLGQFKDPVSKTLVEIPSTLSDELTQIAKDLGIPCEVAA